MEYKGQSVICIFKVTPQAQGTSFKNLVNIYTIEDGHFEDQAIKIKKLFYKYKARRVVIDGNGLMLAHLKLFELLGTPNVKTRAISSQVN